MKFQPLLLAALIGGAFSMPVEERQSKPPYFLLTGDSTVAKGGGWGDGLLSFLKGPAKGENHGKGGATTVSFRAEGRWDTVIKAVKARAQEYRPIVTIQFGHNDQKKAKNISPDQFQKNLEKMAQEVTAAGGTPILISSLTRRTFKNGKVVQNLAEERQRAHNAAKALDVKYLELNQASTTYIDAIGQQNADSYNLAQGDRTHLNESGTKVFGRMVVDLLVRKWASMESVFEKEGALSKKIWAGEFATGNE